MRPSSPAIAIFELIRLRVDPHGRRDPEPGARDPDEVARPGDDEAQDDEAVEDRLRRPQERQVEQEPRDVLPEDRVRDGRPAGAERHPVEPQEDGLPASGKGPTDDERDEDREAGDPELRERGEIRQGISIDDDRARTGPEPRAGRGRRCPIQPVQELAEPRRGRRVGRWREASGDVQVAEEHDQGPDEPEQEESALRADARPQDGFEADAAVPEDVRPEADPDREEQDDHDGEPEHEPAHR